MLIIDYLANYFRARDSQAQTTTKQIVRIFIELIGIKNYPYCCLESPSSCKKCKSFFSSNENFLDDLMINGPLYYHDDANDSTTRAILRVIHYINFFPHIDHGHTTALFYNPVDFEKLNLICDVVLNFYQQKIFDLVIKKPGHKFNSYNQKIFLDIFNINTQQITEAIKAIDDNFFFIGFFKEYRKTLLKYLFFTDKVKDVAEYRTKRQEFRRNIENGITKVELDRFDVLRTHSNVNFLYHDNEFSYFWKDYNYGDFSLEEFFLKNSVRTDILDPSLFFTDKFLVYFFNHLQYQFFFSPGFLVNEKKIKRILEAASYGIPLTSYNAMDSTLEYFRCRVQLDFFLFETYYSARYKSYYKIYINWYERLIKIKYMLTEDSRIKKTPNVSGAVDLSYKRTQMIEYYQFGVMEVDNIFSERFKRCDKLSLLYPYYIISEEDGGFFEYVEKEYFPDFFYYKTGGFKLKQKFFIE